MTKPPGARTSPSRAATLATVLGVAGALVAQSQRLPLVAVVCVAVGLAPMLGITAEPSVAYRYVWRRGRVLYVGDTLAVTVVITNTGDKSSSLSTVTSEAPGLVMTPITKPQLRAGEQISVEQQVVMTARRGPVTVTTRSRTQQRLVGDGKQRTATVANATLLPAVRPRPVLPPAQLVDLMSRPADEGYGTGRRGNADPMSLRRFASGDPVSSVHWRSTARAGVPIVMEREQLASGVLVLLVATSQVSEAWEAAVARAAGLVQAAAQVAVPVQVVAAAPAEVPVGVAGHEIVQDWLAGLTIAGPAQPELLERAVRVAAGGLIAVLSAGPWLTAAVVEAGAARASVVDLISVTW